jgi:TonB-linked SusC/RagA family outer membrane protein
MLLKALCVQPYCVRSALTKTLLIMKFSAIFILAACLQVSAKTDAQITVTAKNATLREVFKQLQQQTGYDFLYSSDLLKQAGRVTVDVKNVSLETALQQCLKDKQLTYSIVDRTIIIKPAPQLHTEAAIPPPPIEVRGRVINEKGEPVEGVTVTVKGSAKATATDANGVFVLTEIKNTDVLVFTGVQIETAEIKVNNRTILEVTLKDKITTIQEVTVSTGYQTISRERSAGSFAKADLSIVRDRSVSMNVLQRLDGLIPGLTINNAPGSEQVLIRGLSSINGAKAPLYVVDGIPLNEISSINPQDVSDVTVLKDATAASIWGSRASNGVIVITTRKGTVSDKLRIQYDGFVNFQGRPDLNYIPAMNSREMIQTAREIFDPVAFPWNNVSGYVNIASVGVPPHEMILYNQSRGLITPAQANQSLDSLANLNNRDQIRDLWYRNAVLMNHTVSLSGGTKAYSFYGSLAYTNTQSNRPGELNNTYKVNLRQDFNLHKYIQAYLITDLTNNIASSKRTINVDNRFYPYQLFKDDAGNNLSMPYMATLSDSTRIAYENRSKISLDYNPLNEYDFGYTKTNALLNRIISGVTVKLLPGLRFEGTYGYIKGSNNTTSFVDEKSHLVRQELVQFTVAATPSATPVYYLPTTGGRYTVNNTNQRNWTVRNQLHFDQSWNKRKHQFTALAGQEAQEQLSVVTTTTLRGYNETLQTYAAIDYLTLGTTGVASPVMANNSNRSILSNDVFRKTEQQVRFTSYYANAGYTYNKKYSLNASWRIDQSNLFGIDKAAQNKPVWSVGGKWLMSEEKFMNKFSWINRLGLRATYGVTGNAPTPGTASSYDILVASMSNFLPGGTGVRISTPGNTKLTWESTNIINLGADVAVLNNRLSGSIDVYWKNTQNLIGVQVVNSFTGYATITGNFGDLKNRGVELSITSVNVEKKNFTWTTLLNMAYNKNIITNLVTASPVSTGALKISQRFLTGYSAFSVFAYNYAGLDTQGDPMIQLADKTITKTRNVALPGDVLFMGTYQPVWSGGLSNLFRYKKLSLSVNAIYNMGHVMRRDVPSFFAPNNYSGRLMHSNLDFQTGNGHSLFLNRWRQPGDEAFTDVPSFVSNSATSTSRREIMYYLRAHTNVLDASFVKLRDVTLAWSLPNEVNQRLHTEGISLRIQLSNVMLWRANKYGIDPEFHESFIGIRSVRANQGTIAVGAHITF